MAENKKSFILYADLLSVVKKLVLKDREDNTNHAGELFLHILEYVNDNEPVPINFIVDMAFEPIKISLKRDLKKYECYIEKQRLNGSKGGRPRKEDEEITKKATESQPFLEEAKKADSDSVSDSVNVNDINNKKILLSEVSPSDAKNLGLNESYLKVTQAFHKLFTEYSVKITGKQSNRLEKAKLTNWYETTRLTIEADKNTIDELRDVYNFLKFSSNDFWISTISSVQGIRKNFDKLLVDAKKEKGKVAPKEKEKTTYKGILSSVNRNPQNK